MAKGEPALITDVQNAANSLRQAVSKLGADKAKPPLAPLSSALKVLQIPSPPTKSLQLLESILRRDMVPLYECATTPALRLSSAVMVYVYREKVLPAEESNGTVYKQGWESVQVSLISGLLDFLDAHTTHAHKEQVAIEFYPLLCNMYLRLPVDTGIRPGEYLIYTIYQLISETATSHAENQRRLRNPSILGSKQLGYNLSCARDFLTMEALLELLAKLLPSVISPEGRTRRANFIEEVFDPKLFRCSKIVLEYLNSASSINWEDTSVKIMDALARQDIRFPQPFDTRSIVLGDSKSFTIQRIYVDQNSLTANVETDGLLDTLKISYSSIQRIQFGKAVKPRAMMLIKLSSPPLLGRAPVGGGCNVVSFEIWRNDIKHMQNSLEKRGLTQMLGSSCKQSKATSSVDLNFEEQDASPPTTQDKVKSIQRLWATKDQSHPKNSVETSPLIRLQETIASAVGPDTKGDSPLSKPSPSDEEIPDPSDDVSLGPPKPGPSRSAGAGDNITGRTHRVLMPLNKRRVIQSIDDTQATTKDNPVVPQSLVNESSALSTPVKVTKKANNQKSAIATLNRKRKSIEQGKITAEPIQPVEHSNHPRKRPAPPDSATFDEDEVAPVPRKRLRTKAVDMAHNGHTVDKSDAQVPTNKSVAIERAARQRRVTVDASPVIVPGGKTATDGVAELQHTPTLVVPKCPPTAKEVRNAISQSDNTMASNNSLVPHDENNNGGHFKDQVCIRLTGTSAESANTEFRFENPLPITSPVPPLHTVVDKTHRQKESIPISVGQDHGMNAAKKHQTGPPHQAENDGQSQEPASARTLLNNQGRSERHEESYHPIEKVASRPQDRPSAPIRQPLQYVRPTKLVVERPVLPEDQGKKSARFDFTGRNKPKTPPFQQDRSYDTYSDFSFLKELRSDDNTSDQNSQVRHSREEYAVISRIVETIDAITDVVLNNVQKRFSGVKRDIQIGQRTILKEAADDLKHMRVDSVQHYNDLIELEAAYASNRRVIIERWENLHRAEEETNAHLTAIIQKLRQGTLTRIFPASLF
ncbi:hypothetical protein AX16_010487 [Volvariella volvacea WC 439]|nr:hypothetical protein AX16_010487 [Volvariella volvacea WC 439]